MKRVTKQIAAALAVSALSIGTAHAVLVTQWDYTNEAGFSDWAPVPDVTASGDSGDLLNLPTTLSWGTNNESSLVADSPVSGTVDTNGAPANGVPLIHNNFPIALGISLDSAVLSSVLTLVPIAPNPPFDGSDPPLQAPTIEFDILFAETENNPASGICADGSLLSDPANDAGCQDIFVLSNPDALGSSIPFSFDGVNYLITIGGEGLGALSDEACAAAGADDGCIGFLTEENTDNTFQANFTITAQIPEPAMLGLLGLALGGMGFARLRRK